MRCERIYFLILGGVSAFFGFISISASIYGKDVYIWIIKFPSDGFSGGWGGLILLFAGFFYIYGTKNMNDIHQLAKIYIGSIMVWIVGGSEIIKRILESIPGKESWFNTFEGFASHYMPPYHPSILLLPFSLIVLMRRKR